MSKEEQAIAELLSDYFGQQVQIHPLDFLEKSLAGLYMRQPDMSGDQRKRLNGRELRAVQSTSLKIFGALLAALRAPKGDAL